VLELLSALYNGEMRPVRRPAEGTDLGLMLPYKRLNFGLDALELRGAGGGSFAALVSLKDYPDSTAPGLTDALLRLPCELVLTETYAPADRQVARERIDLAIRRLRSADEEAMAERREMQSARDALGTGSVGFGDHHLSVLVRAERLDRWTRPAPPAPPRWPMPGRRGARGREPGARLLGPVPRQRGLSRAPRADFQRQHGLLRLAPRLSRWARPRATTGARR
jgi:hypothetical protein